MPYYQFKVANPETGDTNNSLYGSYETFLLTQEDLKTAEFPNIIYTEPGWYWWACFPGCLPDGDAIGPYKTEAEARTDAEGQDERAVRQDDNIMTKTPDNLLNENTPTEGEA